MKTGRLAGMVKPLNLKKVLTDLFGFVPEEIIVTEPRFFKNFKEVFNADTFEMYKNWAYVTTLMGSCSLLTEELRELGGAFSRALSGIAIRANHGNCVRDLFGLGLCGARLGRSLGTLLGTLLGNGRLGGIFACLGALLGHIRALRFGRTLSVSVAGGKHTCAQKQRQKHRKCLYFSVFLHNSLCFRSNLLRYNTAFAEPCVQGSAIRIGIMRPGAGSRSRP
jgi:hypothetical protein